MNKTSVLLPVILFVFCLFSYQELTAQIQSFTGKDLAAKRSDNSSLYINVQQQYTKFAETVTLNQSSAGVKLKKPQYTLISNFQTAYDSKKTGWQSANEFYYTPAKKKTYQYAFLSFSNAKWHPSFVGAVSNYFIGIKNLEIENGVKYVVLPEQNNIWMINTGVGYAARKNLFTAKWVYLNNKVSNNDFILGYRYYFDENSVIAFNALAGDNNIIPEYRDLPIPAVKQFQKYYGFNFNTTFNVYKNIYLGASYTYNHFKKSEQVNSWNLHIANLSLIYKLF